MRQLLGRSDFTIISELVDNDSKVLDLGCGDGLLLAWLADNKGVEARGLEINGAKVQKAIARGVSVYQGDIEQGLRDYPALAFDYVILSQTLQETHHPLGVLREMLRISERAIVAFTNFGHWSVRMSHLWTGRAPRTKLFPHNWYDSPNIHFMTVRDFEELAEKESIVPSEPDIHLFEELFLKSVRGNGRVQELKTVMAFNLRTRHPFKDMAQGLTLMKKGAISPLDILKGAKPHAGVSRIFTKALSDPQGD